MWTDPACCPRARHPPVVAEREAGSRTSIKGLGEAARGWRRRLHAAQVIDPAGAWSACGRADERGEPILMVSASDAWLGDRAHALAAAGVTVTDPADGDAHA